MIVEKDITVLAQLESGVQLEPLWIYELAPPYTVAQVESLWDRKNHLDLLFLHLLLIDASGRDVQPALVIGRHYMTERDSAPVQYNGVV